MTTDHQNGERHLDEVLQSLAVTGPDADAVVDYAMGVVSARSRRQRLMGVGAAALVLLGAGGVIANTGGTDPDEVVATASSTTTTEPESSDVAADTTVGSTAPTTSVVPATTAAPLTLPIPRTTPTGLPPQEPATTTPQSTSTTTPPDRPGTGSLVISPGAAGDRLEVRFDWSDPDGPGTKPLVSISTDEPGTDVPKAPAPPGGSCTGGPGSNISMRDSVQFASTGSRVVRVSVAYCNAPAQVFSSSVTVGAPTYRGQPGRAVMAELPKLIGTEPSWTLTAEGGTPYPLEPADSEITHPLLAEGAFSLTGVVVVVPANVTGSLSYRPDGPNGSRYSGILQPAKPGGSASHVRMLLEP